MSSKRRDYAVNIGIPSVIFILIAVVIGSSFVLQRGWEPSDEVSSGETLEMREAVWQAERKSAPDPLVIGELGAPIELVVFSDYQCPFCSHWSRSTLPKLMDYVDEGSLRIIWRDANLSGEASERGARAVYAAALQDKFMEFHQALMQDGRGASDSDLEDTALVGLAKELGLDTERFAADMNSAEAVNFIRTNEAEGRKQGVTRAPSFVFDDQFISGVQPTDAFINNLEAALKKTD